MLKLAHDLMEFRRGSNGDHFFYIVTWVFILIVNNGHAAYRMSNKVLGVVLFYHMINGLLVQGNIQMFTRRVTVGWSVKRNDVKVRFSEFFDEITPPKGVAFPSMDQ